MLQKFTVSIFVLVLAFQLSIFAQSNSVETDPNILSNGGLNFDNIEALWDVQFNYDATAITGAAGNAGALYIEDLGEFWTSRWASAINHRWTSAGTLIEEFTITGVTGVRAFTYDGTFVYAGLNTNSIAIIDPTTRSLVGTITAPQSVRYLTYDPTADGGAGGFWLGNFSTNLQLISMSGTVLVTHPYASLGVTSIYGAAWDGYSAGGPFLWLWGQGAGAGTPQWIVQINPATGLPTGVTHDVMTDIGLGNATAIAGGLFIAEGLESGFATLGGLLQGTPNRLFGYELAVIIPVELSSFTASSISGNVTLNWTTASEVNNQGFEVQKMSDGEFITIGFVNGFGTTTEPQAYIYTDRNAVTGTASYRLKQIDFDGKFEYSDVVEIEVAPSDYILNQNYPNPFNPSTQITFGLITDSRVTLKVFDLLGQEIKTLIAGNLNAGLHEVSFNAAGLNTGVYFYRLEANGIDGSNFVSVKKMLLTK